jgi:hypothetical protein
MAELADHPVSRRRVRLVDQQPGLLSQAAPAASSIEEPFLAARVRAISAAGYDGASSDTVTRLSFCRV